MKYWSIWLTIRISKHSRRTASKHKSSTSQPNTEPLTAQQVYELTSQVLQEHLQLDMSNSDFEADDIWDVLVAAAVQRLTIETASKLLESTPSPNTVRNAVYDLLGDDEQLSQLETILNEMLLARLPKKLMHKARPCAANFTEIPYQGRHEAEDNLVRRGRAKSGTTHFHCYATRTSPEHPTSRSEAESVDRNG